MIARPDCVDSIAAPVESVDLGRREYLDSLGPQVSGQGAHEARRVNVAVLAKVRGADRSHAQGRLELQERTCVEYVDLETGGSQCLGVLDSVVLAGLRFVGHQDAVLV